MRDGLPRRATPSTRAPSPSIRRVVRIGCERCPASNESPCRARRRSTVSRRASWTSRSKDRDHRVAVSCSRASSPSSDDYFQAMGIPLIARPHLFPTATTTDAPLWRSSTSRPCRFWPGAESDRRTDQRWRPQTVEGKSSASSATSSTTGSIPRRRRKSTCHCQQEFTALGTALVAQPQRGGAHRAATSRRLRR